LLTDCIIVLSPVYCDIIGANKIDDDDDDDITVLDYTFDLQFYFM